MTAIIELDGVEVHRGRTRLVGPVAWRVEAGERWVIVGPNGSGKSTLLRVASTYLWPSAGTVAVLGARIGTVDARELRRRVGYMAAALADDVDPQLSARDVVVTARHGALGPWWHEYTADDLARADFLLARMGIAALAERQFGTLSSGERQRVQVARALMPAPELLLLDEPAAALDLGAREGLVDRLEDLARDADLAALVLVTHHLEEIPPGFTHALVLARGRAVAAGPIEETLATGALSEAFEIPLVVDCVDGRFHARRAPSAAG
ncbi:MAG TPA: ABC transporter ATP-binding protein [Candidatus Limnocylindrales bacterium]